MTRRMIPLSEPVLDGNEAAYLQECVTSGWVSSVGPFVERFEKACAELTGAPHAVSVACGTAGLHTALMAVGVGPGDEVLVPDLTFVAPAYAVRYCGAFPVFIDVDPKTWQIDPLAVERFLAEECELRGGACVNRRSGRPVKALVPVHLLGSACDIERLVGAARRSGLKVVEDAAEGVGTRIGSRHVGTFGDAGVLSFNGNKIATAGGGGMIVTSDAALAKRCHYLTTQAKDDALEYVHNEVGYNYRLTNLQAAVGVAQLERLDARIARKKRIAEIYRECLQGSGIECMPEPRGVRQTYWLFTVRLPGSSLERRQGVVRRLHANGVGARPLWHDLSRLKAFDGCQAYRIEHSRALYEQAVSLPSGPGLTDEEVVFCAEQTSKAVTEAPSAK